MSSSASSRFDSHSHSQPAPSSLSPPPPPPPLPPLPPPAPPLPPQRYSQRAATAIARLAHPFIYSSRPPSPHARNLHRDGDTGPGVFHRSIARNASPLSSKTTAHKTGIPINALDISGERTHAILAGRDILKTIRVHNVNCIEDFNLRSTISAYASAHNASKDAVSAQHRDQLAAYDVKWSRGNFSSTIATAAANGRIIVYDVERPGVEIARLHEHTRQVHRLAFNPYQGALLISGSQDGTVRMWDMRDLRGERSARLTGSIKRFFGNSDGIRDLRWSPTDGVEFATGTDSGAVQKWDFRKENAPILKINAHDKTCLSIDWHPSGRYLASGSADKNIKVWDFKSADRRMKPSWQLRAPQAVSIVRWRPVDQSPGEAGSESRQSTYLASSYNGKDPRVHIWDFRRPHLPSHELDKYDTPPTDMLWHSEDLIWTVSSAGIFTQTDFNFLPKPLEKQSVNIVTTAPNGQFCYFSDSRPRRCISLADAEEHFLQHTDTTGSSGEKLSGSHSATDGSLEETSMLGPSFQRHRQKPLQPRFSTSTPVSSIHRSEKEAETVDALDAIYRLTQNASYGHVLGVFDIDSFTHLAHNYELPSASTYSAGLQGYKLIMLSFERNAILAAQTGQFRLAQTWRILGHAAKNEIKTSKWSGRNRDGKPLKFLRQGESLTPSSLLPAAKRPEPKFETSKPRHSTLSVVESSSNVPTPIAKPAQGLPSIPYLKENLLDTEPKDPTVSFVEPTWHTTSQFGAVETLSSGFPPQVQGLSPKEYVREPYNSSPQPFSPSFGDFPDIERQMEERRSAMSNYRAKPRAVFRLEDHLEGAQNLNVTPRLDRHDSSESFQMFSASSDSEPHSLVLPGSFGETQRADPGDYVFEDTSISSSHGIVYGDLAFQSQGPQELRKEGSISLSDSFGSQLVPTLSIPLEEERGQIFMSTARTYSLVKRPSNVLLPTVHTSEDCSRSRKTPKTLTSPQQLLPDTLSEEASFAEVPLPWSLTSLLPSILTYHLSTLADSQLPSFLALFLAPLLPHLFEPRALTTSYLLAYHSHLDNLRLYEEAARFRNACHFSFPSTAISATQGPSHVDFWCENCGKSVKGDLEGWCARCCSEWGACPICESPNPPPSSWLVIPGSPVSSLGDLENPKDPTSRGTSLWAWCQGCGHGGHSSCLRAWWHSAQAAVNTSDGGHWSRAGNITDMSEGACPVIGCGHDCVAGQARMRQIECEKRRSRASVLRDDWVAGESRAVERTRGLVAVGRSSSGLTSDAFFPEGKLLGLTGRRARLTVAPEEQVVVPDGTHAVRESRLGNENARDKDEQVADVTQR